jgi:hypothetical protein
MNHHWPAIAGGMKCSRRARMVTATRVSSRLDRAWRARIAQMTRRCEMPDKKTIARAKKDKGEGKSASTQAGEFVRGEIEHVREGKHGAR